MCCRLRGKEKTSRQCNTRFEIEELEERVRRGCVTSLMDGEEEEIVERGRKRRERGWGNRSRGNGLEESKGGRVRINGRISETEAEVGSKWNRRERKTKPDCEGGSGREEMQKVF